MAISASITLTSAAGDLVTNALSLSDSTLLTKAGAATALDNTSGLARKTTTTTDQYTLFYADEYTADKAHKLYLKNTSVTPGEFFTVNVDDEKLGLMYAGDWALIPWAATDGTKAAFTVTFAATWATNDTAVFDGVTITLAATETTAAMAILVAAAKYPNFTATVNGSVVTFTAKDSNNLSLIEEGAASDDYVITTGSNGTGTVDRTVAPVASANDIKITPSTTASHTLEHMLFHE